VAASGDTLFDVEGRVVVITGGFGQLGSEYAAALADRGARVALFDLAGAPKPGGADLSAGLADGSIRAWPVDVTERGSIEGALAEVVDVWDVPHALVNNAAIDAPPDAPAEDVGPFEEVPVEALERVMRVNVTGTVLCCQVVGGAMAAAGRGSIVNISSVYGLLSPVQELYDFRRAGGEEFVKPVAYSVSKSAVLNLTRYLATYWAPRGVRVNTLTLAGVRNDQPLEFVRAYTARVPIGRMLEPREAVGAIVFFASDASSYVTGANLVVDGGWTAW
jgi:NAD(P)-dependent dehydrogenase (short-subunit alcohol dehydrogenase family)